MEPVPETPPNTLPLPPPLPQPPAHPPVPSPPGPPVPSPPGPDLCPSQNPTEAPPTSAHPSAPDPPSSDASAPSAALDAIDALDETLERALGSAATGLWSFAARVQSAVPARADAQAAIAAQAKRAREIDLASVREAAKGVVGSVRRNAGQVEEALREAGKAGPGGGELSMGFIDADVGLPLGSWNDAPSGKVAPGEEVDVDFEMKKAGEAFRKSVGDIQASAVGQTVGNLFGSLSMWAGGKSEVVDEKVEDGARDAPKTRFEALVMKMELNPDTYCSPPAETDAYAAWGVGFDLDMFEPRCVALLDRHSSVSDLYERVVPRVIDEDTFWKRFFFARHMLDVKEEQRISLLQRAVGGAEEDADAAAGWDDDDDDWDDSPAAGEVPGASVEKDGASAGQSAVMPGVKYVQGEATNSVAGEVPKKKVEGGGSPADLVVEIGSTGDSKEKVASPARAVENTKPEGSAKDFVAEKSSPDGSRPHTPPPGPDNADGESSDDWE